MSVLIKHIYIHIPFCLKKCGYCNFYSEPYSRSDVAAYLILLHREIDLWEQFCQIKCQTLYFGGGTPSLLTVADIDRLCQRFPLTASSEVTLEANPVNIDREYAGDLFQTPVNRISLGAQSFRDSELRFLGRLHDRAQAIRAYHNLREAGFDNVSLDLIYGLPGQTARELALSLEQLVELEPRHVSTYCLSLADQVPLSAYKNRIPSDRVLALFYRKIRMQLTGSGYRQYEISNFCSPGFHSRHNKAYWDGRYYLGLGPAAAGYLPGIRYHHPESLRIYEKMIRSGDILSQREILNSSILEKEYIMLKLRTSEGMMLADYKRKFGFDFEIRFHHLLKKYDRSILPCQGGKLKISADYYFVSDEIIADFIAVIDSLE